MASNLYKNPYYNFLQPSPGTMAAYGENIDPCLQGPPPTLATQGAAQHCD